MPIIAPAHGRTWQLGTQIELPELLALPPDGHRYMRDREGRLALMSPDSWESHGTPLVVVHELLQRRLRRPWRVLQERPIAFPQVFDLRGNLLRESFLGPKAVAPDFAICERMPGSVYGPHGLPFAEAAPVRLVIEILSEGTWRSDLGVGEADEVDRSRTYLASGVAEYWILNAGVTDPSCPVKPRTGRFLHAPNLGRRWETTALDGPRIRSHLIPDLELDLDELWRECAG